MGSLRLVVRGKQTYVLTVRCPNLKDSYKVNIAYDGCLVSGKCECPEFQNLGGACEHIIQVLSNRALVATENDAKTMRVIAAGTRGTQHERAINVLIAAKQELDESMKKFLLLRQALPLQFD